MKQILLVCNAGMSTSMLVKKMQQSATERGIEVSIEAKSITEAKKNIHEADVILIGPQIRYELPAVKEIAGDIPVQRPIWIHAVSVGETRAAEPLVQALRHHFPDSPFLITQMTPTSSLYSVATVPSSPPPAKSPRAPSPSSASIKAI